MLLLEVVKGVLERTELPTVVVEVKIGLRRALEKGEVGEPVTVPPRGVGVTSVLTGVNGVCTNPSPHPPSDTDDCSKGKLGRANFPTGAADTRFTFEIAALVCMNFPPERLFMVGMPLLLFTF